MDEKPPLSPLHPSFVETFYLYIYQMQGSDAKQDYNIPKTTLCDIVHDQGWVGGMGGGVRVGQQGQGYETLLSIYLKILLMLILFYLNFFGVWLPPG